MLVPHWVWQTFAVNTCIPSDRRCILRPRKDISHMTGMAAVGATPYSDCCCTPDPLACLYNSKLLSRDYHYQQSCEPNVGTTGGASVAAQSRRVGGGSVGPLSVVGLCSSSFLLRRISNFMKKNSEFLVWSPQR